MRVLVVELGVHYKKVRFAARMLSVFAQVEVLLTNNTEADPDWREHFPEHNEYEVVCARSGLDFARKFLILGRRADAIYVTTGPEYSRILGVIVFATVIWRFRNRVLMSLCNPERWLTTGGARNRIRAFTAQGVCGLAFESETQRESFLDVSRSLTPTITTYDRYVLDDRVTNAMQTPGSKDQIRIGLLGILTPERRNYGEVVRALAQLSNEIRERIVLVTLGGFLSGISGSIVEELSQWVDVDTTDSWLSEKEFETRGFNCHALLSPLSRERNYGTLAGSGSFGDAIYLQRRLIIPEFVDPRSEFSELSITYRSEQDLARLLENPATYKPLSDEVLTQYSIKQVASKVQQFFQTHYECR